MFRLRFLRILLLGTLLVLGGLLFSSWQSRPTVHTDPVQATPADSERAEGLTFIELIGGRQNVAGDMDLLEQEEDGSLRLEGIHGLEIERQGRGPLVVSADKGAGEGETGARTWQFQSGVVIRDPEEGLRLDLPTLEVDEAVGVARSEGEILFTGTNLEGTASGLIYGLRGQASELADPVLEDPVGGRLTARRAVMRDGIHDIELIGDMRADRDGRQLSADRARILRGESGLESCVATGDVTGSWPTVIGPPAQLQTAQLEAQWDSDGEVRHAVLTGDALVRRGLQSIAATVIETSRHLQGWRIVASQTVYVQAMFVGGPGLLRAENLEAELTEGFDLSRAEAVGRVSFESRDTRGEGERGVFSANAETGGEIELYSAQRRKARLARGRTRVAANRIRTDPRGVRLSAQGGVEASLLPDAGDSGRPGQMRLFVTDDAVHFVASTLDSEDGGLRLTFEGSARGWQGERNLAADTIVIDEARRTLEARGDVATRIPREDASGAMTANDYIQIVADHLTYQDGEGRAVYTGHVGIRLAEGWLEAHRVEVDLGAESRRVSEVRAFDEVRLEFHQEDRGPITGTADRAVYEPSQQLVKLLGDRSPASMRRIGGGGTTTGRVLRYRMDTGTLEVDSGGQGPARIRPPAN